MKNVNRVSVGIMLNLNHNVRSRGSQLWFSKLKLSEQQELFIILTHQTGCGDGVFNILPGMTALVFEPEGRRHPDRWWFEQCIHLPSLPLSLHCITNEYSLSQADKKKHQVTVLFFLALLTLIPFPIIPSHDLNFKSVKLIACVPENAGGMSQRVRSYPMGAGLCLWD